MDVLLFGALVIAVPDSVCSEMFDSVLSPSCVSRTVCACFDIKMLVM